MRVLVVEDEPKMADLLQRGLREEGLVADVVRTGADAVWRACEMSYGLILLDVMLPDADGFDVCRSLRARDVWSPVLMLTARDAVEDRVNGLDAGADDYLLKPFSFEELLARIRALARRVVEPRPVQVVVGDLSLDPATRCAWRAETKVALSPLEYTLLETLMRAPGQVLPRHRLVEAAWEEEEQRSNTLDAAVAALRHKVDQPFGRHALETVRGIGYRLRSDGG